MNRLCQCNFLCHVCVMSIALHQCVHYYIMSAFFQLHYIAYLFYDTLHTNFVMLHNANVICYINITSNTLCQYNVHYICYVTITSSKLHHVNAIKILLHYVSVVYVSLHYINAISIMTTNFTFHYVMLNHVYIYVQHKLFKRFRRAYKHANNNNDYN